MKNSTALALNRIFKAIADSAIKVFIPILIYKNTGSLAYAFLYLALSSFVNALCYVVLKNFLKKHAALAVSLHALFIIAIEFLLLIKMNIWLVILISVLEGVLCAFYYSLKYLYGFMDKTNNVAKFEVGQYIGKIVFVIASALFLDNVKNSLVFIVIFSSIFYLLSSIVLLVKIKDIKAIAINKKLDFIQIQKDNKKWNIFHIFNGIIHLFMSSVLPLYLYIQDLSYTKVGIVLVLQYLLNILANYLSMFLGRKGKGIINIIAGSTLGFVSMIIMITIKNSLVIYIMSLVSSFGFTMLFTYMFAQYVADQKQKGYFEDSVFYRDAWQTFSRSIFCSVYLVIPSFLVIFIIGIVSNFMCGPTAYFAIRKKPQAIAVGDVEVEQDKNSTIDNET